VLSSLGSRSQTTKTVADIRRLQHRLLLEIIQIGGPLQRAASGLRIRVGSFSLATISRAPVSSAILGPPGSITPYRHDITLTPAILIKEPKTFIHIIGLEFTTCETLFAVSR